jgi:hypothetical protein
VSVLNWSVITISPVNSSILAFCVILIQSNPHKYSMSVLPLPFLFRQHDNRKDVLILIVDIVPESVAQYEVDILPHEHGEMEPVPASTGFKVYGLVMPEGGRVDKALCQRYKLWTSSLLKVFS